MAKKVVEVLEIHRLQIEVDADSDDEAREKANAALESGFLENGDAVNDSSIYMRTTDPSEWRVWE